MTSYENLPPLKSNDPLIVRYCDFDFFLNDLWVYNANPWAVTNFLFLLWSLN